jgi:5-deoxy-glucuronate isomerase
MEISTSTLLFPGRSVARGRVIARVSAEQAKWNYLNLVVLHLKQGQTFDLTIEDNEYLAVILSGLCNIRTNRENFEQVGRRPNVFSGLPYAVYLPRNTEFTIEAISPTVEIASCWSQTTQDRKMRLITPVDIQTEIIGSGNATYQKSSILHPDTFAHRIAAFETYTPGGNWAHYPPQTFRASNSAAADKSEIALLHKHVKPSGYTLHQIHTDSESAIVQATNNDISVVPDGYWTTACPPGHTGYMLCFVASENGSYETVHDPAHSWFVQLSGPSDVRLPIVDHGMEPRD